MSALAKSVESPRASERTRSRSRSLAELPDALIEERFADVHEQIERLEAERLDLLSEIDRRATYQRDGHLSAASWLVNRFRLGWGAAHDDALQSIGRSAGRHLQWNAARRAAGVQTDGNRSHAAGERRRRRHDTLQHP